MAAAAARDVSSFVNPRLKFCRKCVLSMAKEKSIDSGSWLGADTQTLPVLRLRAVLRIRRKHREEGEDGVNNAAAVEAKKKKKKQARLYPLYLPPIFLKKKKKIIFNSSCFKRHYWGGILLQIWIYFTCKPQVEELKNRAWSEGVVIFFFLFILIFYIYIFSSTAIAGGDWSLSAELLVGGRVLNLTDRQREAPGEVFMFSRSKCPRSPASPSSPNPLPPTPSLHRFLRAPAMSPVNLPSSDLRGFFFRGRGNWNLNWHPNPPVIFPSSPTFFLFPPPHNAYGSSDPLAEKYELIAKVRQYNFQAGLWGRGRGADGISAELL